MDRNPAKLRLTGPNNQNKQAAAPPPRHRLERALTLIGLGFTLVAAAAAGKEQVAIMAADVAARNWSALALNGLFALIVLVLIYGGLVYQFARLSHLNRSSRHRPATREELDALFDGDAPPLRILIPAYKEEPRVVLTTLMSAALQSYPSRRITLLIDDPPCPSAPQERRSLEATRALPQQVEALLAGPAALFTGALDLFEHRAATVPLDGTSERLRLAELYGKAASWFREQAKNWPCLDHSDRFFCEQVLDAQAEMLERQARRVIAAPLTAGLPLADAARREYRRLRALFDVEVTAFERKRYDNLSHEPNKAMNLNSYIGLIGKSWRETSGPRRRLEPTARANADLVIPEATFLVTLDADSLIDPDYSLRLIHAMGQPGNQRLAVIQTPYSAIPGAPHPLERIAGATTDIQYIIHQGFTGWCSTFWVGANALLRMSALESLLRQERERGYLVNRYIQDRTVIEDTESSIDLIDRGWQLHNYPERLAYSATPPDFGSLLIQRRRWANGGLIILPKLLRFLVRGPGLLQRAPQAFMRIHYLASIALVNSGLLIILALPLSDGMQSLWLPLTALPYFALYTRDLIQLGYRASDILRVYALNLVLIPVNLGGVLKSLQQACTRAKIPFGRTPKVQGRTAAAPLYILAVYALLLQWLLGAGFDLTAGRWAHGGFAILNAALLLYGILHFIGLRESRADLAAAWRAIREGNCEPAQRQEEAHSA